MYTNSKLFHHLGSSKKKSRKQKCLEKLQKFQKNEGDEMEEDDSDEGEKDDEMEEEEECDKLKDFKQMIVDMLEENKLITKRSAKLDLTDFLQLLSIFNKKGIHFR